VLQTSAMGHNTQRVDTATLQPICRAPWETFQQRAPRSQQRDVPAVIETMLGWGDPASGSITSLGEHGLEEQRVACNCTRGFCLSCWKVSLDPWVAHSGQTLSEGVASRPVVLTVPKALPSRASALGRGWPR
jgi:hypothetical protein